MRDVGTLGILAGLRGCAWHGDDLATPVGNVLCCLVPGTAANVLIGDRGGPQWAKGDFKDYEMGAKCSVLIQVLWPKRLLSLGAILGEGENQDVLG